MTWQLVQRRPNEAFAWAKDVFSPNEIDFLLAWGYNQELTDATVNNGQSDAAVRRSKIGWISPSIETEFVFRRIQKTVQELNDKFFKFDISTMEDLQFSQYDESYQGGYGSHSDDSRDIDTRKLSVTVQLTEPDQYEGGQLNLYRYNLKTPVVPPAEKGTLIVFPSYVIHEVTPVTKGTRHSLVTWIHGAPFK
jgi:PKHD-type hydroxylase